MATSLHCPGLGPDAEFRNLRSRLALYRNFANQEVFWRSTWRSHYEAIRNGKRRWGLGPYRTLVERYAPTCMPILEAGCGPGYLIAELKEMGFHVVGVDYEGEVVAILRESRPDFDVRVGDVRSLDLPSQSFGCYLSGGIVEHFPEGPEAALAEARRVLHPSGVAFIEVPYLNYFRAQRLARLREHRVSENDSLSFYQYYFDTREFESLLCRAGLRVVNRVRHGAETFLVREHAGFARFWGSCLCREPLKKALRRLLRSHACGIQSRLAHCEIFVCQPMPN